jgi:hypothetical protein
MKKLEKVFVSELKESDMPDEARTICERNKELFVDTTKKVENLLEGINRCPDREFKISICSNIGKIFFDMSVSFAMAKIPEDDSDKTRYIS